MTTLWSEPESMEYHLRQWRQTKESTKEFISFLDGKVMPNKDYLDLGCGAGAATFALSQRFRDSKWTGIDIDPRLTTIAKVLSAEAHASKLDFFVGDLQQYQTTNIFDGVVSLQTLSWLDDFRDAFRNVLGKIQPNWFAISSLFFEGNISSYTKILEHKTDRVLSYNTYSIPLVKDEAAQYNYSLTKCEPFEIDIDLPKPVNLDSMATYTLRLADDEEKSRLQISGPILMNWYMLLFEKI
jgi:SAM-dependent methyltransferase